MGDHSHLRRDQLRHHDRPGNDPATTITTNAVGKTVTRKVFQGTTPTGTGNTTTYTYNPLQNMTGMTDTSGNTWAWAFDPLGRQTSATDSNTGTTTTTYDASGRQATSTNALGTVTTTEYDTLDRPTKISTTVTGQSAKTLSTHTYDAEKKARSRPAPASTAPTRTRQSPLQFPATARTTNPDPSRSNCPLQLALSPEPTKPNQPTENQGFPPMSPTQPSVASP